MDKYFEYSNSELIDKFKVLVNTKQNEEAMILWGLISFDSEDQKKYWLVRILKNMNDLDRAKKVASNIENNEYAKNARCDILETYAQRGDTEGFVAYYKNDYNQTISNEKLCFLLYVVIYNSGVYMDLQAFSSFLEKVSTVERDYIPATRNEEERFLVQTLQMTSIYIESLCGLNELSNTEGDKGKEQAAAKTVGLYKMLEVCSNRYIDDYPIEGFNNDFNKYLKKFFKSVRTIFKKIRFNLSYWNIYFTIFEKLTNGNRDTKMILINEIKNNIGIYNILLENHLFGAEYPLIVAYSYSIELDADFEKTAKKMLEEYGYSESTLSKASSYYDIMEKLSKKSRVAYKAALTLYNLAKGDNYEQKDASPISLAFYRIIELESNNVIWKPIVNELTIDKINEEYVASQLSENYTWKKLKKTFNDFPNEEKADLMLGDLQKLMGFIKNPSNHLEELLKDEFEKKLTEEGLVAFRNGLIDEWYSAENKNKYRNPPAHGKYVHFKVVEECKAYVDEQLLNLHKWFK